MSLCICSVSPELSLLIYKLYGILVTREASDDSVHMCSLSRASLLIYKLYDILVIREASDEHMFSLARAFSAYLQTVQDIGDQRTF